MISNPDDINLTKIASLGKGRFGSIGCYYDKITNLIFAVKHKQFNNSNNDLELKILLYLNSNITTNTSSCCRYICEVLDSRIQGNNNIDIYMKPYLGGPLHRHIKTSSDGRLPISIARNYLAQIICGLWFLFSHQCVHRDLKANNVLLDHLGQLKICDFGYAVSLGNSNKNNNNSEHFNSTNNKLLYYDVVGTYHILSPEMVSEDIGYDYSVDWWALGILL